MARPIFCGDFSCAPSSMLRLLWLLTCLAAPLLLGACDGTATAGDQVAVEDVKQGSGRAAVAGDRLRVTYVGSVLGKQSFDAGTFWFVLGTGEILQGLDQGIAGMKVGGTRRITVPAALGYGAQTLRSENGETLVPAGATLVYTVDLLANTGPLR